MRIWTVVVALLPLMNAQAFADVSASACSSPYIARDFGATSVAIYYSTSSSVGTYRICSLKSPVQITLLNPNGTQVVLDLSAPGCMDVSSSEIAVSAKQATSGSSVVYCKAG
jgi:hypothetical protein